MESIIPYNEIVVIALYQNHDQNDSSWFDIKFTTYLHYIKTFQN